MENGPKVLEEGLITKKKKIKNNWTQGARPLWVRT